MLIGLLTIGKDYMSVTPSSCDMVTVTVHLTATLDCLLLSRVAFSSVPVGENGAKHWLLLPLQPVSSSATLP